MEGRRKGSVLARLALVAGALACSTTATTACGGDDGSGMAWTPTTGISSDGGVDPTVTPGDSTGAAGSCEPGAVQPCLCPDGLSLGEEVCGADGAGFGACTCAGDTDSMGSGDETGDPMPPLPDEVCYLGGDGAGTTCLPLVAFYADLPAGYAYPEPMRADGQDRPPLGLVDVTAAAGSLMLAPNFRLDELAQAAVGQWAVIQPHAVASLQAMRDQAGPIGVVTGYLSPSANTAQGGDPYVRHMWGDGFDLDPVDATLGELADLCTAQGGAAMQLTTHVHCDLSATPLDEAFFGPPPGAAPPGDDGDAGWHTLTSAASDLAFETWIERDGFDFWAPAVGVREGEPRRQWTARDATGRVLLRAEGETFAAPPGTREIEVLVGGRVLTAIDVASP